MVQELSKPIVYPDSDGQSMADNTKQFRWIVTIKENLERLYSSRDDVFIAGDLLWYPVEGEPKTRVAPDVLVVFGRPKGDRGSYQQWREANVPPQVVFEILSPGNTLLEMLKKQRFYERHGVEEYYIYDPDNFEFTGLVRTDGGLDVVEQSSWISPRLHIRFELTETGLVIFRPDGQRFLSYVELGLQVDELSAQLELERQQTQKMADKLRELGIDPDSL